MLRSRHWLALAGLASCLLAVPAHAGRFELDPMAGITRFDDKLRADPGPKVKNNPYFGGRLSAHLASVFWLDFAGGMTSTKTHEDDLSWSHFSGNLMLSPEAARGINPFLEVGGGVSMFDQTVEPVLTDKTAGTFEQAAGLRLGFTDALGIRLEARNVLLLRKGHWERSSINNIVFAGGLVFGFGGAKPRDSDGDGVSDRRDKCPDTPRGCTVDANGCPSDADGDGVCDGLDQCPNTPKGAKVDARGCPIDSDHDGVPDGIDQCPDTPAGCTVDAKGCPVDSDHDGVCDGVDQCANTPAGCMVDAKGCPIDSDGDGVCDGLDKCPNTPAGAKVDASGCPVSEAQQHETELLQTGVITLHDINFETAKANILPDSRPHLDAVGEVLSKYPQLKIEIGGHTDSRGSDAYNLALSRRRAAAVRTYLLQHFPKVKASQLTAKGYGESKPLVANDSPENMAKNRRVEFVVLNKEVLEQIKK